LAIAVRTWSAERARRCLPQLRAPATWPSASSPQAPKRPPSESHRTRYQSLKKIGLGATTANLGLEPGRFADGRAFAVLMEFTVGEVDALLFCAYDVADYVHIALYTSAGVSLMGETLPEFANEAAHRFLSLAQQYLDSMSAAVVFPAPRGGATRFYAIGEQGVLTAEVTSGIAVQATHFAALESAGHAVIHALQQAVAEGRCGA
jgi:hypothetical protein